MHVGGWYEGNHHSYLWEIPVFFFFGRHFAKFQPEKYEFDLCKGILMKKMAMGYGLWDTKECEL
jgi:hypothetical protein